jgi:hypothetical protein
MTPTIDASQQTERLLRLRCEQLELRCRQLEEALAQALAPAIPQRIELSSGDTVIRVGRCHRLVISACGTRVQVQTSHGAWKTLGEFASEDEAHLYAKRLRGGPEAVRNRA